MRRRSDMAPARHRTPEDEAKQPSAALDAPSAPVDWHNRYQIENPAEVDAYVRRHPSVAAVLAEAPDHVRRVFDEAPRLVVRLEVDEDAAPVSDGLVVDILTSRDAADTQARLARFDARWWLGVLPGIARDGAAVVFVPRFV